MKIQVTDKMVQLARGVYCKTPQSPDLSMAAALQAVFDSLEEDKQEYSFNIASMHSAGVTATLKPKEERNIIHKAVDEDDGWIEWSGGECPVNYNTQVEIRLRNGEDDLRHAGGFRWDTSGVASYDIVAYRIIKPREPEKKRWNDPITLARAVSGVAMQRPIQEPEEEKVPTVIEFALNDKGRQHLLEEFYKEPLFFLLSEYLDKYMELKK